MARTQSITFTLFISLFVLFTLAPVATAELDIITYSTQTGFSAWTGGDNSIELCQCETYTESITVMNTGVYASRYTITGENVPSMVQISTTAFELLPDEQKTVYLYVQAPCEDSLEEEFTLTISDVFGDSYTVEKSITSGKCQNLEATLLVEKEGPYEPCESLTYYVSVENTGVFQETYLVDFGGEIYAEAFSSPQQTLIINAGEKATAESELLLDCSINGELDIPFIVEAQNNHLKTKLEHNLIIENAYDFGVEVEEQTFCALEESRIPLLITNNAAFTNTYTVTATGLESGIVYSEDTLSIAPDSEEDITLTLAPTLKEVGEQTITIIVTEIIGGNSVAVQKNMTINSCYGLKANIDLQEDITTCSGRQEIDVLVENTGLFNEDVTLSVNGSEHVFFEDTTIEVDKGEEETATLIIDVPPGISHEADITILASLDGVDVVAQDSLHISMVDEYACYGVTVKKAEQKIKYSATNVSFILSHVGMQKNEYELEWEGDEWLRLAENEADIGSEGANVVFFTYQDETSQDEYDGTLIITTESDDGRRDISYEIPLTVSLHPENFLKISYNYFNKNPCHFAGAVLVLLFLVGLSIVLFRAPNPRVRNNKVFAQTIVVWALLAIILVSIWGLPPKLYDTVEESNDPLEIVMAEDTQYVLNLSTYFIDEDGDELSFSMSNNDNISVDIANEIAFITPQKDWAGQRRFRITAYDGQGGETESPRMSLVVVDRPEYTLWTLYERYCGYVNIFLLLLIALIIPPLTWKKENIPVKKEEKKEKTIVEKKKSSKKNAKKKTTTKKKRGRPPKKKIVV